MDCSGEIFNLQDMNIVPIIFTTSGVSELCMRVLVHVGTVVNNKLQSEIQCRAFIDLPREGVKSITILRGRSWQGKNIKGKGQEEIMNYKKGEECTRE